MRYYLSLGSNIGDRKLNLELAIKALLAEGNILISKSAIYETEPIEMEIATPFFYNQAIIVESKMEVVDFLLFTKSIEKKFGRIDKGLKKNRSIDIDLIFCDDLEFKNKELTIPHPKMQHRKFVLQPFLEICPEFIHPTLKKSLREIASYCLDKSETVII